MITKQHVRPEADRICNSIPSRNTERDWRFEDAIVANAIAALPASVDIRAKWWNIGFQENTVSWVGCASTDGVTRYHMVKASEIGQPGLLSPRCTWMASKETDQYTSRPETFYRGSRHEPQSGHGHSA
jgi:hypothetical protein